MYDIKTESYKDEDYIINKTLDSKEEISAYKACRDKYIPDYKNLNEESKYWYNQFLMPYRVVLENLAQTDEVVTIKDDLITTYFPSCKGERGPFGDFGEMIRGTTDFKKPKMMIPMFLQDFDDTNCAIFAHEWGHQVHKYISSHHLNENAIIRQFYLDALEKNSFITDYAKTDEREYFAESFMAYYTDFVSYNDNMDSNNKTPSRLTLKAVDPQMYDLIDYIIHNMMKQTNISK